MKFLGLDLKSQRFIVTRIEKVILRWFGDVEQIRKLG